MKDMRLLIHQFTGEIEMASANWKNRTLFHGDNLMFLRAMNSSSVDLIATDPPFNKGKDFHATPDSLASGARFQDRWVWKNDVHDEWVDTIRDDHPELWAAIITAKHAHSEGMGAFLCFMSVRLLAMHRVLKPSGSIYVHCDQTANSYIRMMMDCIFGHRNMINEITWIRCSPKNNCTSALPRVKDTIFAYSKSSEYYYNVLRKPLSDDYVKRFYTHRDDRGVYKRGDLTAPNSKRFYEYAGCKPISRGWAVTIEKMMELEEQGLLHHPSTGKGLVMRKLYLDDSKGEPITDIWDDIRFLSNLSSEKCGYATQKPIALYERIIKASCPTGGIVLDPFAGCATTCVAAERLGCQWVGMDLWEKVGDVIHNRMKDECGDGTMFADPILLTTQPPIRTDDGMVASKHLSTPLTKYEPEGNRMSRDEMKQILLDEHGAKCQGCDHSFHDHRYLELDHNTPKSDGGLNHISNRVLLCSPCNRMKSNQFTLSGLRRRNAKEGYMAG